LQAVLEYIQADSHADIGSDHAYLPLHLLASGRVQRCIAVEKNLEPLEQARRGAVRFGLPLETRHGDGLRALRPGEVSSLSFCGMGAKTIRGLLERDPEVLEAVDSVVAQPNDWAEPLRRWANSNGFWLERECLVPGFWDYTALHLRREPGEDPAYVEIPLELGYAFGPHLLRQKDARLQAALERTKTRLERIVQHANPRVQRDLMRVQTALEWLNL